MAQQCTTQQLANLQKASHPEFSTVLNVRANLSQSPPGFLVFEFNCCALRTSRFFTFGQFQQLWPCASVPLAHRFWDPVESMRVGCNVRAGTPPSSHQPVKWWITCRLRSQGSTCLQKLAELGCEIIVIAVARDWLGRFWLFVVLLQWWSDIVLPANHQSNPDKWNKWNMQCNLDTAVRLRHSEIF